MTPEFDKFARDYSGGNEDPFKRLFGDNLDQFIYVKAKWLWNYFTQNQLRILPDAGYHLLDYDCGTGKMLKWLKTFGFPCYPGMSEKLLARVINICKVWR